MEIHGRMRRPGPLLAQNPNFNNNTSNNLGFTQTKTQQRSEFNPTSAQWYAKS